MQGHKASAASDLSRHESELETEIDPYLKEKERIRTILGRVGGVPRKRTRIVNTVFLVLVAVCFLTAMFVQDPRNIPLEVAILLVSLKLIFVLGQNARVNHFQFWMLSTIEWRLNEISKDVAALKDPLRSPE